MSLLAAIGPAALIGGFFSSVGGFLVSLLALILALIALYSIVTSSRLTTVGKLVWAIVVIIFPIVGSIVWFVWGINANVGELYKRP